MALFWFLLALALLVVALVILRLDAKQRAGGPRSVRPGRDGDPEAAGAVPPETGGDLGRDGAAEVGDRDGAGEGYDGEDDEARRTPSPAGGADSVTDRTEDAQAPRPAPFQRAVRPTGTAGAGESDVTSAGDDRTGPRSDSEPGSPDSDRPDGRSGRVEESEPAPDAERSGEPDLVGGVEPSGRAELSGEQSAEAEPKDVEKAPKPVVGAGSDDRRAADSDPATDQLEPATGSSPGLLDRVRSILPARRQPARVEEIAEPETVDPLAGSLVVRWLEDREFAPTPTPAPQFLHGDFAGGLSALGTVSHGVFRGRRAIMGVTGGRTVLALRRESASDVVLDLSRPDVDAEPGFHDAGTVGSLEARTSDIGRLDLLDRSRLTSAVADVPAGVRRIWAEDRWVAATIDGVDDPGGWDDVVMALHAVVDVVAPLPPVGGHARPLPADVDPGAPAAADGPQADPTVGMDGEVIEVPDAALGPDPEGHVVVEAPVANNPVANNPVANNPVVDTPVAPGADLPRVPAAGTTGGDTATTAPTAKLPAITGEPVSPVGSSDPKGAGRADGGATDGVVGGPVTETGPAPRRGGHLRLVPDRSAARSLTDLPVKADRGDSAGEETGAEEKTPAATAASDDPGDATGRKSDRNEQGGATAAPADADVVDDAKAAESGDDRAGGDQAEVEESDPFGEIMDLSGPVGSRGDVAADHLAPKPPLARPTRGVGQVFPEDASVPPLAAGVVTGGTAIKPLGSEDDEEELRDEVERFDAARIDGRSDFDAPAGGRHEAPRRGTGGRHGVDEMDPSEVTQKLSVAELAERMGIDPSEMRTKGRRRRHADDGDKEAGAGRAGSERPGVEPDLEQTTRIELPPDIRD